MHSTPELFEDVMLPGALEIRSQLADDLTEMRDQLHKQIARLKELRIKKAEQPGRPLLSFIVLDSMTPPTPTAKMPFMALRIQISITWT